jgi:hypothetical protein
MSVYDLTTLANVKAWLGLPSPPGVSDAALAGLVTAASRAIYAALSRPSILPQAYVDTIDLESDRVHLANWPVGQITSVLLDGLVLPAAAPATAASSLGWLLRPGDLAPPGRPQALDIFGRWSRRRRQILVVSYSAGYAVYGESETAPSAAPYQTTAVAPFGPWASDLGVVYASSGFALQRVVGAPAQGQYAAAAGVYRFNAADAGAGVLMSYGFAPQDLVQAATELAAERFRAADHIGQSSKTLGGQETINYISSAISAPVMALISPYKRTAF